MLIELCSGDLYHLKLTQIVALMLMLALACDSVELKTYKYII